ncbi:VOC family protein [Litchfieldella rifensis]|uniref:VOC family protein n=1 Tax=Litchfieldella rifensis TaxID=762643 RepID=A0ABV7LPW2_9GAMM
MMQRLSLDKAVFEVRDLDAMQRFCQEVLNLVLLLRTPRGATFELGADEYGHTQVLMLLAAERPSPPRRMTLEVTDEEFPGVCERLRRHGATLFESEGSSAPGCAWRVLHCEMPEGHHLQVISIDPRRCAPASLQLTTPHRQA